MKKKTLVLGASNKPERYAYMATERLLAKGHPVHLFGLRADTVLGLNIETDFKNVPQEIDTVTMYLGPKNQLPYYDFLKKLKPKRVIFNPGTENLELETALNGAGIETIEACTLVMLGTGQY